MHGVMNKKRNPDDERSPLNKITDDDTPHINRGVELLLRNKRRTSEQPKTFQMKFGKMFSLFRREINIHLDFSLDCKKKESH
jgi:hypothetical protein